MNRWITKVQEHYGLVWTVKSEQSFQWIKYERFENWSLQSKHWDTCISFFTGCEIGAEGAKELSEMLKVNTSLRKLNLDCYREISMGRNTHLKFIDEIACWTDCKIEDSGVKALCEMLKLNTTLTLVNIDGELKQSGQVTKQITHCVMWNTGNDIGCPGAKELGEMLKSNCALTELDLDGDFLKLNSKRNEQVEIKIPLLWQEMI